MGNRYLVSRQVDHGNVARLEIPQRHHCDSEITPGRVDGERGGDGSGQGVFPPLALMAGPHLQRVARSHRRHQVPIPAVADGGDLAARMAIVFTPSHDALVAVRCHVGDVDVAFDKSCNAALLGMHASRANAPI